MATLDAIRSAGEADLERIMAKLDRRHRAILRAAIERYGNARDIPQAIWDEIRRDIEEEEAAALLVLMLAGDEWATDELSNQGIAAVGVTAAALSTYSLAAARRAQETAAQTTDTLRDRLGRKIEDAMASGPGRVGELTPKGIDDALGDVFSDSRRKTIAIDQTTTSLSTGQRGAAARVGGDGAATVSGQRVTVLLIWRTERDNVVCMRCAPLEGQPEEVWGRVFPNGPGPECHPNCRCWLDPRVIVEAR